MKTKLDARLIALGEVWAEAERRDRAAWRKRDELEGKAQPRSAPEPLMVFRDHHCVSLRMVLALCRPHNPKGPSAEAGKRAWAEHQKEEAAYRRRRRAFGLGPIDAEVRRWRAAWRRSMLNLIAAPAESAVGIAIKLRPIRDDFRDGAGTYSDRLLRSALRDAERLAKGAAA